MLIEREGVINTGNAAISEITREVEDARIVE
jgi:hypothetical protein